MIPKLSQAQPPHQNRSPSRTTKPIGQAENGCAIRIESPARVSTTACFSCSSRRASTTRSRSSAQAAASSSGDGGRPPAAKTENTSARTDRAAGVAQESITLAVWVRKPRRARTQARRRAGHAERPRTQLSAGLQPPNKTTPPVNPYRRRRNWPPQDGQGYVP